MATIFYSEVAKKAKAKLSSQGLTDPSFNLAGLVVLQVPINVDTTIAVGDKIVMTQAMSRGIALVPALCQFYADAGDTSSMLELEFGLGDEEKPDRYFEKVGFTAPASGAPNAIAPGKIDAYGVDFIQPGMCLEDKPIVATVKTKGGVPQGSVIMATLVFASVA